MKESIFSQTAERITNGVAVGAVSSPLWLQHLSDVATLLLPIAGLAWLLIQMYGYIKKGKK